MNKEKEFKKVLLVSNYSIFENSPVGITLRSLYSEWPNNKMFEIYRYQTESFKKSRSNIYSYKVPIEFLPVDYLFRKALKKEIKYTNTAKTFQISKDDEMKFTSNIKNIFKYFSESIFLCKKNSVINEKLDEFKPEVIYTIGESLYSLNACLYFSKKYNVPIVVHYMDNWRETIYPNSGINKILKMLFKRKLMKVEEKMSNGLVISPKMKKYYSEIDPNTKFNVLLNSVENPKDVNLRSSQEDEVIFTYIGGLHLERWSSLLVIEKCLNELNNLGISSKLLIYTPKTDEEQFSYKFNKDITVFKGYVTHDKVHEAYGTATILLHVESFNEHVVNYTKYSLSTKIPECMAKGKPILCFAPTNLAVSEYINENAVGYAVNNYPDLLKASKELSLNRDLRNKLGTNGIKIVRERHTHQKALEILFETL